MRRTNTETTDDQLVAEVGALDRDQMISPLERFVRAGRLTLFVDRDDGKLKLGLYHRSPADLHAAEARAEAVKSQTGRQQLGSPLGVYLLTPGQGHARGVATNVRGSGLALRKG